MCLATSLANPKPDYLINIIINKPKDGAMPKVVGGRRKKIMKGTKIFKFLNQCFGKSVSNSQNLLAGSTAVLLKTLF